MSKILTPDEAFKQYGICTIQRFPELEAFKSQEFLLEPLIPAQSTGILIGASHLGKTPLSVQLALSAARGGGLFLGRYALAPDPIEILYVDLENGAQQFHQMVQQLCGFLGMAEPPPTFRVLSTNYSPNVASLDTAKLCTRVEKCGVRLVIVDSLRCLDPETEKKNENAMKLIQTLRQCSKRTGATFLLIHHPRKLGPQDAAQYSIEDDFHMWLQQGCGAGALIQNVDFRLGVDQWDEGIKFRGYLRTQALEPVLYVKRELDEDGEPKGYVLASSLDKLTPDERRDFLRLPNEFETADVKRLLDRSAKPANDRLLRWQELALIVKVGRGRWRKCVN